MDLMGVAEIAVRLSVSKQRADQITRVKTFPKPVSELAAGRIWTRRAVERWISENRRAS